LSSARSRRLIFARFAVAALASTCAALAALWAHRAWDGPRSSAAVRVLADRDPEPDWGDHRVLTPDPVAGFRPKRSVEIEFPMAALDDSARLTIVKRRDRHGFLRADALPEVLQGPRIVALGDSHLDGVVPMPDNLGALLEAALRERPGGEHWVLNAGCGFYSLFQYALRARTLVARYRPQVVIAVVFCGNDFLELDNQRFPHLDDELRERPPNPTPPPERTSERKAALDLFVEAPFWQGLNQALYLHQEPERVPVIERKAGRAVDLLETTVRESGAQLLWVLLPSFDLVFPDRIASASPLAGEVVGSGVQQALYERFRADLQAREARVVDMLPIFRADGSLGIYAIDFHIFVRGHRLVADAVLPVLRDLLAK
jgi:hypothetical protein